MLGDSLVNGTSNLSRADFSLIGPLAAGFMVSSFFLSFLTLCFSCNRSGASVARARPVLLASTTGATFVPTLLSSNFCGSGGKTDGVAELLG